MFDLGYVPGSEPAMLITLVVLGVAGFCLYKMFRHAPVVVFGIAATIAGAVLAGATGVVIALLIVVVFLLANKQGAMNFGGPQAPAAPQYQYFERDGLVLRKGTNGGGTEIWSGKRWEAMADQTEAPSVPIAESSSR